MGQVKIYGLRERIKPIQEEMSEVIHSCLVDAFKLPVDKKFQRFILLDKSDFYYGKDRSENYTVIEISIFVGRSMEAKKELINLLFTRFKEKLNFSPQDVEITIFETQKCNWGIRGLPGDELVLNYKVEV